MNGSMRVALAILVAVVIGDVLTTGLTIEALRFARGRGGSR